MRDSNKYDGTQVVIHTIKKGETLSSIAQRYHFESWTPIWVYNTQIRPVLKGSPENVPVGANIFIPRSKDGYARLMRKFEVLALEMRYTGDVEVNLLDAEYYQHQANRVRLNALGDALTTIATVGLQASKAAEMFAAAEKVSGIERVAAEYLATKESEKVVEKLTDSFIEKLKDLAADRISSKLNLTEGQKENFGTAYKAAVKTTPKVVGAIRGFSLQGGKALLDISEIVLQYVEPSTIADLWLAHVVGIGTPKSVYESSRDQIAHAITDSCTRLYDKRLRIERERNLLYSARPSAKVSQQPFQQRTDSSELDKAVIQDDKDSKNNGLDDFNRTPGAD